MIETWNHISINSIGPNVECIHCDTRDFFIATSSNCPTKETDEDVYRLLHGGKINEKFLIEKAEIFPWLAEMERISGGRNEWRCLNFTHIKTEMGWLKYIRFYRYSGSKFVVCDSYGKPIDWRGCNEETIEGKYLNAHS